jgi:hypothetical protein
MGNLDGSSSRMGNIDVNEIITPMFIFRLLNATLWIGLIRLRIQHTVTYRCNNSTSGSIKGCPDLTYVIWHIVNTSVSTGTSYWIQHADEHDAKFLPWPKSASELYRQSDSRLSAKLVPTFADRGVSRGQRGGSLGRYLGFLDRNLKHIFA